MLEKRDEEDAIGGVGKKKNGTAGYWETGPPEKNFRKLCISNLGAIQDEQERLAGPQR